MMAIVNCCTIPEPIGETTEGCTAMPPRRIDEQIVLAWKEAAQDLRIGVVAPFELESAGDKIVYEAHILDFGGPKGTVAGVIDDEAPWTDARRVQGYYGSNLSPSYRRYDRQLFIDTLNDWQWFGQGLPPIWYTGKPWS